MPNKTLKCVPAISLHQTPHCLALHYVPFNSFITFYVRTGEFEDKMNLFHQQDE